MTKELHHLMNICSMHECSLSINCIIIPSEPELSINLGFMVVFTLNAEISFNILTVVHGVQKLTY